jgi:hypothetical protein
MEANTSRDLLYSVNLDPQMIEHQHFETFLAMYRLEIKNNILFEISERTTNASLNKLKTIQADFALRYVADDLNSWDEAVRSALTNDVEMSKADYKIFQTAMQERARDPLETTYRLQQCKLNDRPLIVEGARESDFRFLREYWDFSRHGFLYGQGENIRCGYPWEKMMSPLQQFGHSGGWFLLRPEDLYDEEVLEPARHRARTRRAPSPHIVSQCFSEAACINAIPDLHRPECEVM